MRQVCVNFLLARAGCQCCLCASAAGGRHESNWDLPTFVYTLPFVLYLGSAKLAMAPHFLVPPSSPAKALLVAVKFCFRSFWFWHHLDNFSLLRRVRLKAQVPLLIGCLRIVNQWLSKKKLNQLRVAWLGPKFVRKCVKILWRTLILVSGAIASGCPIKWI